MNEERIPFEELIKQDPEKAWAILNRYNEQFRQEEREKKNRHNNDYWLAHGVDEEDLYGAGAVDEP